MLHWRILPILSLHHACYLRERRQQVFPLYHSRWRSKFNPVPSIDLIIYEAADQTAGLTLAARLSEDASASVLVLEAGEGNLNDPALLRPASYGSHYGNKRYDWDHSTVKQKHANGRIVPWHRGKGLGGSSAINFMGWNKPPADEIDDWGHLGNEGWNWENYQRFIARTEGFVEPPTSVKEKFNMNFDDESVGRQGPLKLGFPGLMNESEMLLQKTFLDAGIPLAPRPVRIFSR
ncbi:hypothetical protein NM688_g7044 [Phlebia brevispora]|uniref:Uncharacterized protein n=1 Tax=Phlebia brevispora TaxID=194682 RepID=A0ACC1S9P0_9APHY|nr:hypothetical protein NM688_g7044 [Phlebia brevispora]